MIIFIFFEGTNLHMIESILKYSYTTYASTACMVKPKANTRT